MFNAKDDGAVERLSVPAINVPDAELLPPLPLLKREIPSPASSCGATVSNHSDDFELLDSSGYISEAKDQEWSENQTRIRRLLELRSTVSQKVKGLRILKTMLVAVEKVAPTISLASGMDERTADFSPGSKDVLAYIAGNLEKLLIMTDDETKSYGKVEEWLPEAALLYGRSLALFNRLGVDIDRPEGWYSNVVSVLLRSVERDSRFLRCEHCDDKQYYHPVQLRLLLILDVHLGLWNHSQDIAETHLVDVLLPLQHSLHACKERIRRVGHKLLAKTLRSHKVSHGRVNKGVEILCVTSYDAALEGLQAHKELHPERLGDCTHFLKTIVVIWQESPSSLRFKLNAVRSQRYFEIVSLFQLIRPMLDQPIGGDTILCMTKILPLLAAWEPVTFAMECLKPSIDFLVNPEIWKDVQDRKLQGGNIEALGLMTRDISIPVLPYFSDIFLTVKTSLVAKQSLNICYVALKHMLEGLGPTARQHFTQILGTIAISDLPVSKELLDLLCDVPDLITGLASASVKYLKRLLIRYEVRPENIHTAAQLAILKALPQFPLSRFPELAVQARVFLSLALAPQAPTDIILAALADCTIEALCNRDTSLEIVEAVLRIVEERNDGTILEACLGVLKWPSLEFSKKPVAAPLMLRLNQPDTRSRRIIAQLLNLLGEHYTALIMPLLRTHVRSTLIVLDSRESQTSSQRIQEASTLCLILPSLPPALSLQYSRPIVSLLLEELVGGQADVDAVNICTESLAYLARNCPHAWDKELLRSAMEPVSAVSREANYQTRLSGLDCLAAFMAIPISWGQHNEAMMLAFAEYVGKDATYDDQMKSQVTKLIGAVGTTDRNPKHTRDHLAAIRRENDIYPEPVRRRMATAMMRDKRGAKSTAYHLSLVSDILTGYLALDQLSGRLAAWEAVMKTIILVGNDSYADSIFPNILSDLVDEFKACNDDSNRSRNSRAKLLTYISHAVLLRPDYNTQWPAILHVLRENVTNGDDGEFGRLAYPTLLVCLSMVFRCKGDLATLAREILPLLRIILERVSDADSKVLALRLVACCQSHAQEFLGDILESGFASLRSSSISDANAVALEILSMLSYLARFLPFFEFSLQITRLLDTPVLTALQGEDVVEHRAAIARSCAFSPVLPSSGPVTDYPDLRRYQDAQFGTLAVAGSKPTVLSDPLMIFDTSDVYDEQEWSQWLYNLAHSVLLACPVDLLKVVVPLHPGVRKDLLHASFVPWWESLAPEVRKAVESRIINIIEDVRTPENIIEPILSIVEFMHRGNATRLSDLLLATAQVSLYRLHKNRLNEKIHPIVLWYAEIDCATIDLNKQNLTALIETNIRLGVGSNLKQDDAAFATIDLFKEEFGLEPKSSWLQALGRWDEAIITLDRESEAKGPLNFNDFSSRIVCLHSLMDFDQAYQLVMDQYDDFTQAERSEMAHFATIAAWAQGDFENMARFASNNRKGSTKFLYKAILDVWRNDYPQALKHIAKGQAAVYDELHLRTGQNDLSVRNYAGAIKALAKSEMLAELTEVIHYKQSSHSPEYLHTLRNMWQTRMKKAHPSVSSFWRRLSIWSLAAPSAELQNAWIYLACLAHKEGLRIPARRILAKVGFDVTPGSQVKYSSLKFDWEETESKEKRWEIMSELIQHTLELSEAVGFAPGVLIHYERFALPNPTLASAGSKLQKYRLSRCLYRLSKWDRELRGDKWIEDPEQTALKHQRACAMLDPDWYFAVNDLAAMSLEMLEFRYETDGHILTEQMVDQYILPSLYSLFRGIVLEHSREQQIKSTLLVISLWFRWGSQPRVLESLKGYLLTTDVKGWLAAVPQLIARLGAKDHNIRESLLDFLKAIANGFPDALIWPLLMAAQTPRSAHQNAAKEIMMLMSNKYDNRIMVQEAQLVGRELIRTAVSFAERWKYSIEKLLYIDGLSAHTWPTFSEEYANLSQPQTEEELLFVQRWGDSLWSARKEVLRYFEGAKSSFHKACAEYQTIHRKLTAYLESWKRSGFQLDLFLVAPQLVKLRDCRLIVPGQYDPAIAQDDQQFIRKIETHLDVLPSKQLPRKLIINSNTETFMFLLKGMEDLRQDERIMQLISLVNLLFCHNTDSFHRQLFVQSYNVTPLSPDCGLLTWVSNTETYMQMITSIRSKIKGNRTTDNEMAAILGVPSKGFRQGGLDVDRIMNQYVALPLDKKVDRLKAAWAQSKQDDLKQVLWKRSCDSRTWLSRRTCFARSIATTSMVGYIIGLGDRHPQNTLVEQLKFNAISIDFGDVFETAEERIPFPEKVPFRLTRQITNTFELAATFGDRPPGSRGHFKISSVITMRILRENADTLLAMLVAFAYDPMLSWQAREVDKDHLQEDPDGQTSQDQEEEPLMHDEEADRRSVRERREDQAEITIELRGTSMSAGTGTSDSKLDLDTLKQEPSRADLKSKPRQLESINEVSAREEATAMPTSPVVQGRERRRTQESLDGDRGSNQRQRSANDKGSDVRRPERPSGRSSQVTSRSQGNSYDVKAGMPMTNDRALAVLNRIEKKLCGRDGPQSGDNVSTVENQVQRLIHQATAPENLAQGYILGWLPYW